MRNKLIAVLTVSGLLTYLTSFLYCSTLLTLMMAMTSANTGTFWGGVKVFSDLCIAAVIVIFDFKSGFFLFFPAYIVLCYLCIWIWGLALKLKRFLTGSWIGWG